jgi:tetratricopeptide (TPR) repeat protein
MRRLILPGLVLAAFAYAAAAPARAEEGTDAARRLYEAGTRDFEAGRFREAAAAYERAYQAQPLPAFVYNAASAYDKAGAAPEAIAGYKRYVGLPGHDVKDEPVVKARIEVLEKMLLPPPPVAPKRTSFPYVDPTTKHSFPTYTNLGGRDFTLLGAGAPTKAYAVALYVEDEAARAAFPKLVAQAGGADHASLFRNDQAAQFVVLGDFSKHAIFYFDKPVAATKLREMYKEALAYDLGPNATPELRRDVEAFLALFDRDMKAGEELHLHTDPDGDIFVRVGRGFTRTGPHNARVVHDLWDAWLGAKPIAADLKQRLLERIDSLGR